MADERGREELWTLDELSARVALALSVDYDGQPSGRVRDVPDGRVVRYYTTLGLVDRPRAYDGRVALYTARHLQQILGIKRLQQEGASLAHIQQVFLQMDEPALERLAAAPPEALAAALPPRSPAAPRDEATEPGTQETAKNEAAEKAAAPARASKAASQAATDEAAKPHRERFWNAAPADAVTEAVITKSKRSKPETLTGVALSDAALLLAGFSRELSEADVEALRAAAAPLLAVLERRGLL